MNHSDIPFRPANESRWFIAVFDLYVRALFKRRFHQVRLDQRYHPQPDSKTIYFLNHTSWWDGLIPFLLNQKRFRQQARAMMEDKQMNQYPFFRKIGAFSVNLSNPRSAVVSLRYAVQSMNRPNASLFIYPEGELVPFSTQTPSFKKGLAWIIRNSPGADVVPIGIYFRFIASGKPELFLRVGSPVDVDVDRDTVNLKENLEAELGTLLRGLQNDAHYKPSVFSLL